MTNDSVPDLEHNTQTIDIIPVAKSEFIPYCVQGTRNRIKCLTPGYISIDCTTETIDWWLSEEAEKFALEHGFTSDQIQEYKAHIRAIKERETSR
jgi:hypothetical protein